MSMRNYAIVDYGIVVMPEELNLRAIAAEFNDGEEMSDEDVLLALEEDIFYFGHDGIGSIVCKCHYSSDIEGDFVELTQGIHSNPIDVYDDWALLQLPRYPSLYQAAYQDEEDLIREVKEIYAPFIKEENFDWASRLVRLEGVIYG